MIILNFDKTAAINMNYVADIHIQNDNKTLTIDYANNSNVRGGSLCAGKYQNKEECSYTLEMYIAAVRNGETTFEFPTQQELAQHLQAAKQCGIHVKTEKNRHGGS